jgi:hypothetical protein
VKQTFRRSSAPSAAKERIASISSFSSMGTESDYSESWLFLSIGTATFLSAAQLERGKIFLNLLHALLNLELRDLQGKVVRGKSAIEALDKLMAVEQDRVLGPYDNMAGYKHGILDVQEALASLERENKRRATRENEYKTTIIPRTKTKKSTELDWVTLAQWDHEVIECEGEYALCF